MTDQTLIQWPRAKYWDKAWNPIIGCRPISPACDHCYAAAWARRFHRSFAPNPTAHTRPPRSGVVFCGNLTDLFGDWCVENYFATRVFGAKATYLWLTKRVDQMCADVRNALDVELSNHYFGFTAENQEWYDERRVAAAVAGFPTWANLWLSCEPLLGRIDVRAALVQARWLVVGCESGPNRRPCKIEWVESIVEQCLAANVPVFVKQLDLGGKCVTDINKFPPHFRIRQVPWAKEGETR